MRRAPQNARTVAVGPQAFAHPSGRRSLRFELALRHWPKGQDIRSSWPTGALGRQCRYPANPRVFKADSGRLSGSSPERTRRSLCTRLRTRPCGEADRIASAVDVGYARLPVSQIRLQAASVSSAASMRDKSTGFENTPSAPPVIALSMRSSAL
jgi:hypothetical protein